MIGSPIAVGEFPYGLAFDPIHSRMYVVNHVDGSVSVIDTNTNTVVGSPLLLGDKPYLIAFAPPQPRQIFSHLRPNLRKILSIFRGGTKRRI